MKKIMSFIFVLILVFVSGFNNTNKALYKPDKSWWRDAKFGLFIHWGVYAIPAQGEWYMTNQKVPREEYHKLPGQFNPTEFNAKEWVKVAKDAGMNYIVITAKHHDGFAMYDSKVSDYDIVDATPFKRDPMADLAKACAEEGIRLGFYYSHAQDWNEPNGAGRYFELPPVDERDFDQYFYDKALPQIREILTQYGPIWELWLDTPSLIKEKHNRDIMKVLRELQPDCLVTSRIGPDLNVDGDFISCFDNTLPSVVLDNGFEVPATLTDGWGYKYPEGEPDPLKNVIGMLCDIAGMGGNYLLNVGPSAKGVIPQAQIDRLKEAGDWLKVHGDAIYGTYANPFGRQYEWGTVTTKPGKIFLIFFEKPSAEFNIYGIKNDILKAYWIHNNSEISFNQDRNPRMLTLKATGNIDNELFPVAVLEIDGDAEVELLNYQQGNGEIILETVNAMNKATETPLGLSICERGTVWKPLIQDLMLSWEFYVTTPGSYKILLNEFGGRDLYLDDFTSNSLPPHQLEIKINNHLQLMEARGSYVVEHRFNDGKKDLISEMGTVQFDQSGRYMMDARIVEIGERKVKSTDPDRAGEPWEMRERLVMNGLKLVPVE